MDGFYFVAKTVSFSFNLVVFREAAKFSTKRTLIDVVGSQKCKHDKPADGYGEVEDHEHIRA